LPSSQQKPAIFDDNCYTASYDACFHVSCGISFDMAVFRVMWTGFAETVQHVCDYIRISILVDCDSCSGVRAVYSTLGFSGSTTVPENATRARI
jgi:uncharacterized protein YPO0396